MNFSSLSSSVVILILFISGSSRADIVDIVVDQHIKPTLERGFDSTGLAILLGGAASGYAAYTQEDHLRREWGENKLMSKDQTRPGDLIGMGLVGGAVAVGQFVYDSDNGWAHTEALVWTFVTTHAAKYGSQKYRPNGLNRLSMPSGHSSTAFASATHLAYAYGWWAGVPAILLASYTAVTRIADDAHWYSDVVAGAALGIFWGRATSDHHKGSGQTRLDPWIMDDGGTGLKFTYKY